MLAMGMTKTEMTEAILENAAELAEKLDMYRISDITDADDGDTIMIASAEGIAIGELKEDSGHMRTYMYCHYNLNGKTLCTLTYQITEQGYENEANRSNFMEDDTIIYLNR